MQGTVLLRVIIGIIIAALIIGGVFFGLLDGLGWASTNKTENRKDKKKTENRNILRNTIEIEEDSAVNSIIEGRIRYTYPDIIIARDLSSAQIDSRSKPVVDSGEKKTNYSEPLRMQCRGYRIRKGQEKYKKKETEKRPSYRSKRISDV